MDNFKEMDGSSCTETAHNLARDYMKTPDPIGVSVVKQKQWNYEIDLDFNFPEKYVDKFVVSTMEQKELIRLLLTKFLVK